MELRKSLNTKVLSDKICAKIKMIKEYKDAKTVFAYYPKPYEVDISPLFEDKTKQWFLPKVEGDELEFYEFRGELILGKFGVYEPMGGTPAKITPDLIIVPALCVDEKGFRLGYGKGFYDRFLVRFSKQPKTLTPIFSKLIIKTLPKQAHDKPVDIVVDEL